MIIVSHIICNDSGVAAWLNENQMLGCVHWIEIGLSITWYAFFITLDDQFLYLIA